ncbi:MAG: HDOD domain-containing protein [Planctomycetota bacterium]
MFFKSKRTSHVEEQSNQAVIDAPATDEVRPNVQAFSCALARQPIFDRELNVFGYELLARNTETAFTGDQGDDAITANTLYNSLFEIGIEDLVGNRLAFVNLTRNFILQKDRLPECRSRLVLEILENIEIDEPLVEAVRRLRQEGYTFALDDAVFQPKMRKILDDVSIVKLDLPRIPQAKLAEQVRAFRQFPVKILAEKVEDSDTFRRCCDLGIDYFQGYFFARPTTVTSKRMPHDKLAMLSILAALQKPETTMEDLENVVRQSVSLSYRLLRYVNSAAIGINKNIRSIRQAILLVGIRHLRLLASIATLAQTEKRPIELMVMALVRGRTSELLAAHVRDSVPDTYFTAGMFSLLDVMMDVSMEQILANLPLSPEITGALLRREGEIGNVLRHVIAYERGTWSVESCPGFSVEVVKRAYLQAIRWVADMNPGLFYQKD